MISSETLLDITTEFYKLATVDILIGYHFRNIKDFNQHLPHISHFWDVQLNGVKVQNQGFDLLNKHLALSLLPGHLDRWVVLFFQTLDLFEKNNKISKEDSQIFKDRIEFFRGKFKSIPRMVNR